MDLSTSPYNRDSRAMSGPNDIRRRDLMMDEAGIEALLQRGFCWMDGHLHMHGTGARGHLRANIEHEPRACFAIDEPGEIFDYGRFECDSTVSYASVVAFVFTLSVFVRRPR